jgi:endonuclease/exonuclease/phosphatase family metal-dependent hydrolase
MSNINSIRFGTYNIQSGSTVEHIYNLTATAETIKQLEFDIIALQEVDKYIAHYNQEQPFQFFHFEKCVIFKMVVMEYRFYQNKHL